MPEAKYLPTLAEIRAECAKIQETWSDRERRLRLGCGGQEWLHWTPPQLFGPHRRRGKHLGDESENGEFR